MKSVDFNNFLPAFHFPTIDRRIDRRKEDLQKHVQEIRREFKRIANSFIITIVWFFVAIEREMIRKVVAN